MVESMDEVLKVALTAPLMPAAAASTETAVQPAISDDTITH
jgi:hypothetical protein